MASQDKASTSDRLPQIAEDYIAAVVRRMRYRKVRKDVRAELHSHFEDAVSDSHTDQERQATAEQLIENFGDTTLLARLIRRAKKRSRPLWVKVMIHSAQVFGVLFLYTAVCTGRLYLGQPVIKFDLVQRLNQIVSQGRSEDLNARQDIDEAGIRLPEWPEGFPFFSKDLRTLADMTADQRKIVTTYLDDCQPALDLLRQAVEKPYYWGHYTAPTGTVINEPSSANISRNRGSPLPTLELSARLMADTFDKLPKYRHLAQVMRYQIESKCVEGQGARALSDALVVTRLGRHLSGTGLLVEELVGTAIVGLGTQEIIKTLAAVDVNQEALAATHQQFQKIVDMDKPWLTYDCEKAVYYDLIQKGFTDDGQGNGRLLVQGMPLALENPTDALKGLFLFDCPDRKEITQRVDTVYESADRNTHELTPWERRRESDLTMEGQAGGLLGINEEAYEGSAQLNWRVKTHVQATGAILAIKLYEKTYGELPSTLDALVDADILDSLPRDYYSDGLLSYHRRSDKDFILYSWGEDLKDDQGTPSTSMNGKLRQFGPHGDWIFWPVDSYSP